MAELSPRQADGLEHLLRALQRRDGGYTSCGEPSERKALGMLARALYEERRRRERYFNGSLFGEPAWDMLLDLRAQAESARCPSVSSTCIGSATPPSTAVRHLLALESEALVERSPDPVDARRKLIRLSLKGLSLMDSYLAELALNRG